MRSQISSGVALIAVDADTKYTGASVRGDVTADLLNQGLMA